MLSRLRSSIAFDRVELVQGRRQSLLVVGDETRQLLGPRPTCWRAVDDGLPRCTSMSTRSLALRISVLTCWLRSASTSGDVGGRRRAAA